MKTCCEHHNVNCRQGRDCPERTPIPNAAGAMTWFDYLIVSSVVVPTVALVVWFFTENWELLVEFFPY